MAWNPQEFIDYWNGKGLDIDGVAGVQCVDAFKQCLKGIGYPNPTRAIGGSGGAKEIWNRREALGYSEYFEFVQVMEFGDWCIWNGALGGGYGHVAMYVGDNGDGTGQFFGLQQRYTHSPFTTDTISYANSLGALRVKKKYWNNGYDKSQLIEEKGRAYFRNETPIIIHRDSPTGPNFGSFINGEHQDYVYKWIGNGHRYIGFYPENYPDVLCFAAVSATEERPAPGSDDQWATFGEYGVDEETEKPTQPTTPQEPSFPSSVKYHGVDVSSHNKGYDVKGNDFVIIRATYGTNTDTEFLNFVKACNEANIPFGVYCYDYALNDEQALEQPAYIVDLLQKNDIVPKLGVWFDMEDADGYKNKNGVLNQDRCTKSCQTFCDYLKEKGYYTGIYSSTSWFGNMIRETGYPKWIANWGSNDGTCQGDFFSDGVMHQYTSIPLDKDVMYVDMDVMKSDPKKLDEPTNPETPTFPELDVDALNDFLRAWATIGNKLLG